MLSDVDLTPYDEALHLDRLCAWLNLPHVTRWWGDPGGVLQELAESRAAQALIVVDSRPAGFLCWRRLKTGEMEKAGLSGLPTDLIDIDILIGEPALRGRGLGPRALSLLLKQLRAQGCESFGVATAADNGRALRAFKKAGFQPYREFEDAGRRMVYLVQTISGSPAEAGG